MTAPDLVTFLYLSNASRSRSGFTHNGIWFPLVHCWFCCFENSNATSVPQLCFQWFWKSVEFENSQCILYRLSFTVGCKVVSGLMGRNVNSDTTATTKPFGFLLQIGFILVRTKVKFTSIFIACVALLLPCLNSFQYSESSLQFSLLNV